MFGAFFSKVNNFTKLFSIFFLILFLSGCTQSQEVQVPKKVETQYQVSAPWDKELYESFYSRSFFDKDITQKIKGGIVPHHLIAGHLDASFFEKLKKQNPSTIVLIGPNHFGRGYGSIISTMRDWKTPFGITKTDKNLVSKFKSNGHINIEEDVIKEEHSIYSLIPFITKSLPHTQVVPLILKQGTKQEELDILISNLFEMSPDDTVFISSIDFSHYQTVPASNFHDELSINVIKTFEYDRLDALEIDSVPSLYVLMKLMEKTGAQHAIYEMHTNSGQIVRSLGSQNTTSYYSPYFILGKPETEKISSILYLGKMPIDKVSQDLIFTQISGQEDRFLRGMDDMVFTTSTDHTTDTQDFLDQPRFDPIKKLLTEASTGVDKIGYAVGLVIYEDKVSVYIFPFDASSGELKQMEYTKAEEYLKTLIDKIGLEAYTFTNFNTIINL